MEETETVQRTEAEGHLAPHLNYGVFSKEQRFLVKYFRAARTFGVISHEDKLKTFPPDLIFSAYEDDPVCRAHVLRGLFPAFGNATAQTLPVTVCVELVTTAIAAGDVDAQKFFSFIPEEELVRIMDQVALYALPEKTGWWNIFTAEHRAYMAYLLSAYLEEKLGGDAERNYDSLVEAIGLDQFMLDNMPAELRVKILEEAYHCHKMAGVRFTGDVILSVVPPERLVEVVPLQSLIRPIHAAAETYGFVKTARLPVSPASAATVADEQQETKRPDAGGVRFPPPLPAPQSASDDEVDQLLREASSGAKKLPEEEAPATEGTGTGEVSILELDDEGNIK